MGGGTFDVSLLEIEVAGGPGTGEISHGGFDSHRGTRKWMVYNGTSY
jgi:molecular chaperone DnaK (HSP70)